MATDARSARNYPRFVQKCIYGIFEQLCDIFGNIFAQLKKVEEELIEMQTNPNNWNGRAASEKQNRLINKKRKMINFHKTFWNQSDVGASRGLT